MTIALICLGLLHDPPLPQAGRIRLDAYNCTRTPFTVALPI